jgi:phosphoribosyl-ATP pyrophosphohydrolase
MREAAMKTFEELFEELERKRTSGDPESGTVRLLESGVHAIGKKLLEEAGEAWMAARYEGREATAEELSQVLYYVQVMALASGLELKDLYRYL